MESVPLTTLTAQDFNTWLEPESGFNALLGSGISRLGPNPPLPNSRGEIRTGRDIATAVVDALFSSAPTLCHAIIRRFPRQILRRLLQLICHLIACEYTLARRLLGLTGGS